MVNLIKELIGIVFNITIALMLGYGSYHCIVYLGDMHCKKHSELYKLPYMYDISYGCKLKFEGKWYSPNHYELEIIRPKYHNGEITVINKEEQ